MTFFYIFDIFSLFRSCRFYVLAALAYLYILDDSAEAVLFYRKLCFHAARQKRKYKDLIFTAHIGQQNPGITKIIPSVDKRRVCPCQLRVGKGKQKL